LTCFKYQKKGFAMQVKRFLQIVLITTTANVLMLGQSSAFETVVVTGKKCDFGSCGSGPFSGQQLDYDPFGVPTTTAGLFGAFSAEAMKRIVDAIEPPCRKAGQPDADYVKGAVALCVAKAAAGYSATFGVAIGGLSTIITQSQCNTKVQLALDSVNAC